MSRYPGIIPDRTNIHTRTQEQINLTNRRKTESEEDNVKTSLYKVNILLYVEDKFGIFDQAYLALRSAGNLPSIYQIRKAKAHLDQSSTVTPTPSNAIGFQRDFVQLLRSRVKILNDKHIGQEGDEIRVKLSGDGTWIVKNLHVVNVTFTILNEEDAVASRGNYLIAIFEDKEGYDALKEHLADLRQAVASTLSIEVGGNSFKVAYFLGGDYKFLWCVLEIDSASFTYSCIYCKCPSKSFHLSNMPSEMSNKGIPSRTIKNN